MDKQRIDARAGQLWRTHEGHYVRIGTTQDADTIVSQYENGPVRGYRGANFDAFTGKAIMSNDYLVERVQE